MNTINGWLARCCSGKSANPNYLNWKSSLIGVCNTFICVNNQHFKHWKMKWRTERSICSLFMSLLKGADKYDDQVTVVMTILGNSEEIKKFFWFPAGITKTKTYCRLQKDYNCKNSFAIIWLLRGSWPIMLKFEKSAFMFNHKIIFPGNLWFLIQAYTVISLFLNCHWIV